MSEQKAIAGSLVNAGLTRRSGISSGAKVKGIWEFVCRGPDGRIKWRDTIHNLVVDEGLNHILSSTLAAGTQITAWYIGITNASPVPAAADVMSSHAGWTENTNYTEANRQVWTPGAVSGKSVDNSASKAAFNINTNGQTIGGAFLVSNNTKGGTTGTLYSCGAFTLGNKSVDSGDKLEVTATFTQADDGV